MSRVDETSAITRPIFGSTKPVLQKASLSNDLPESAKHQERTRKLEYRNSEAPGEDPQVGISEKDSWNISENAGGPNTCWG